MGQRILRQGLFRVIGGRGLGSMCRALADP